MFVNFSQFLLIRGIFLGFANLLMWVVFFGLYTLLIASFKANVHRFFLKLNLSGTISLLLLYSSILVFVVGLAGFASVINQLVRLASCTFVLQKFLKFLHFFLLYVRVCLHERFL